MSPLEQALADYLQLRRSLGHELAEARWLLPGFVAYLDAHGMSTVTIAGALGWAQESPQTQTGRVTTVGTMAVTRTSGFTATPLLDGSVLVAGGWAAGRSESSTSSAELLVP